MKWVVQQLQWPWVNSLLKCNGQDTFISQLKHEFIRAWKVRNITDFLRFDLKKSESVSEDKILKG